MLSLCIMVMRAHCSTVRPKKHDPSSAPFVHAHTVGNGRLHQMWTQAAVLQCFSASITSKLALAYTQTHISLTNHPMRNLCQCGFDHATVLQASCVAKVSIATQLDVTMAAEVAVPSIYQQRGVAGK